MVENELNAAHWSATPVEVDAVLLMASLLVGIAEGEAVRRSGGFDFGQFGSGANCVLLFRSISQWHVVEGQAWTQRYQAIG